MVENIEPARSGKDLIRQALSQSMSRAAIFHHDTGDVRSQSPGYQGKDKIQIGIAGDAREFEYEADTCIPA